MNLPVHFGSESLSSLAPKIRELAPHSIKEEKTSSVFKNKIKVWGTAKCPCRLCKNAVGQVDLFKTVLVTLLFPS